MTNDYNNGDWWGWNGGECPVHPKSVVEARYLNNAPCGRQRPGGDWIWGHDGNIEDIIAFRVVKAYREPRECWSYGAHLHDTLAEAEKFRSDVNASNPGKGYLDHPITKWVEVLP